MSFGPVNFDNPAQCVGSSYLVTLITGEQCEHSEQALYSIMICVTICRELKFPTFTQAVWGDSHTPQFKYHNIYSFLQKTSPTCITHIENCRANCRTDQSFFMHWTAYNTRDKCRSMFTSYNPPTMIPFK